MYDRACRFNKIYSSTPNKVGPATYYLTNDFGKKTSFLGVRAAFSSSEYCNTSITNKSLVENPSPNKYKICFRKTRIVGGTSIQNKADRIKYRTLNVTRGPFPSTEPKKLQGKVHRGVPPRHRAASTAVSSVPERGVEGYELTNEGPLKVYNPPQDRPIGPTTYYNPQGNENSTSLTYRGNIWSLRTGQRFLCKDDEGPGPAAYNTDEKPISALQKYQNFIQAENSAKALLLRTNDILQRRLCTENLPGPASYSPFDPNTKKCECGKQGTFTKAKRQELYSRSEGPSPAEYSDPRTALSKASTFASLQHQPPFNVAADRFEKVSSSSPGPGDYSPGTSLWDGVRRRGYSKFAQRSAPFNSSGQRTTLVTRRDSACTPAPDSYYPQFQKKGDPNKSYMFLSKSARNKMDKCQNTPGPAFYSTMEAFKTLTQPKSHMQSKSSAFFTSSNRLGRLMESCSPAATTYNLPESLLGTKGCKIGERYREQRGERTPGPPDYSVHPKFTKSSVFDTFNVTFSPPMKKESNKNKLVKKLRCFSSHKYPTGHCSSSYYLC